ncbi:MAG: hypothetical protein ACXQS7_00995 [Candidatus Syntropharchaeia archaeon]
MKKYIKPLAASTGIALVIIFTAFGMMYLVENGSPLWTPIILLIGAIFFVIGCVIFDSRSRAETLAKGGIFSCGATFIVTSITGGMRYFITTPPSLEVFISSLAICMIIGMIMLSLLVRW